MTNRFREPLFGDFDRTDTTPGRYGEDTFSFLNRAASGFWQTIREELQRWYDAYPDEHSKDLRARFQSRRPDQHWGAWWELYLHRVFSALGFSVEVHPTVPGSSGRPDFLVRGRLEFYVEATTVFSGIVDEDRHGDREAWILDLINAGRSANFFVMVSFGNVGEERPSEKEVVPPIEQWLGGLDPDRVSDQISAGQDAPQRTFAFRDWSMSLEAWPIKADARGDAANRLVGGGPMSVGYVNDREMLRRAATRKRRRHSKLDMPLVLAVLGMSSFIETTDVEQMLFGTHAVEIDTGQGVRQPDGLWQDEKGPASRHVSAVLVGTGIHPSLVAKEWPRLWSNPWGLRPLQVELPFPRADVDDNRLRLTESRRPPHEALGLPIDWPGDPERRFEPT